MFTVILFWTESQYCCRARSKEKVSQASCKQKTYVAKDIKNHVYTITQTIRLQLRRFTFVKTFFLRFFYFCLILKNRKRRALARGSSNSEKECNTGQARRVAQRAQNRMSRMGQMEFRSKWRDEEVSSQNPALFLEPISLQVHQILQPSGPAPGVEEWAGWSILKHLPTLAEHAGTSRQPQTPPLAQGPGKQGWLLT